MTVFHCKHCWLLWALEFMAVKNCSLTRISHVYILHLGSKAENAGDVLTAFSTETHKYSEIGKQQYKCVMWITQFHSFCSGVCLWFVFLRTLVNQAVDLTWMRFWFISVEVFLLFDCVYWIDCCFWLCSTFTIPNECSVCLFSVCLCLCV